jgi:TolB-like protein
LSLFRELKRRNVFKVGIAYVVIAWLVAQVLQLVFESFGTPAWVMKTVLTLLATGLPFALFFAWAFEMTPEGLKREHEVDRSKSITSETGRKLDFAIIGVLVVALGYFAYDKFILSGGRDAALVEATTQAITEQTIPEATETDQSIAVLPFVNMSSDKEQEYFSDGLSEELLNLLAKIPELRVIARTSSFAYKGKDVKIADVANELKVAHILEGSVRKSGNQVRVTAQLIRAEDSSHLWSETYDRTLDNIFAIQDEIAANVVGQLKLTLLGEAPRVSETDPEAYALYLQARYISRLGSLEKMEESIDLYKQALAIDPGYAEAWADLGRAYGSLAWSGTAMEQEAGYEMARVAMNRALSIDPDNAPALSRLGWIAMVNHDLSLAASYAQKALALDPGSDIPLGNAAQLLNSLRRHDEATRLHKRGIGLNPVDANSHASLADSQYLMEAFDESLDSYQVTVRLSPSFWAAQYGVGRALLVMGETQAALEAFNREQLEELKTKGVAMASFSLGREADFLTALEHYRERWGEQWPSELAAIYAWAGDADAAFEWLDKALNTSDPYLSYVPDDYLLNKLHQDPRWQMFLEKAGYTNEQLAKIEFDVTF